MFLNSLLQINTAGFGITDANDAVAIKRYYFLFFLIKLE
jgi:hypothetical protein